MHEVDEEVLIHYIHSKTGVDIEVVKTVLGAKMDCLERLGIAYNRFAGILWINVVLFGREM